MKTHDSLYSLINWLREARHGGDPTVEEAEAAFEEIWQAQGPVEHAFAKDYRTLASRLIGVLLRAGVGLSFREAQPLPVDLPSGRIVVIPNEIVDMPGGVVGVRRVRTGHRRTDEYSRLEYALYRLAADAHFGPSAEVLALHLADGNADSVSMTPRKLATRQSKGEDLLRDISHGWFPPKPNAVVCARCPHFFLCPALPRGPLRLP